MFKKKKEENKTEIVSPKERKYYEVWGDAFYTIGFLRTLVIILCGFCVFLIIMLQQVNNKPPVIVKVDKLGYAEAIQNWESKSGVTPPEITQFIKTFLKYFSAYDYYTYSDDFIEAFNMMAKDYQDIAKQYLQKNKATEIIIATKPRTKINVARVKIEKNGKNFVSVKATVYKEIFSYDSDYHKTIILDVELNLKKVKRTNNTPNGLLVSGYNEAVLEEK